MNTSEIVGSATAITTLSPISSGTSRWSIEAISGIAFGVVMFFVTLYTIWQNRRKPRNDVRDEEDQSDTSAIELPDDMPLAPMIRRESSAPENDLPNNFGITDENRRSRIDPRTLQSPAATVTISIQGFV